MTQTKTCLLVAFLLCLTQLNAQHSEIYVHPDAKYHDAVMLYQEGKFEASEFSLNQYFGTEFAEQAAYLHVANAFSMRKKNALDLAKNYLQAHPYTPYLSDVNFIIGTLQLEKKKYKQALKCFEKVQIKELERPHQQDFMFNCAYAFVQEKQYEKALGMFARLENTDEKRQNDVTYYTAYCHYMLSEYEIALDGFMKIENTNAYKKTAPYYIVQINYILRQYDEVYDRAETLLKEQPANEKNAELHRILGEIYYQNQKYDQAVQHLLEYEKLTAQKGEKLMREDVYLLGMSYYEMKQWEKASIYLKKVDKPDDALSQNACYHLGNTYIKLGQFDQAKMQYMSASKLSFNPTIKEQAAYNYALTTYKSSTPLGESVVAFTDFLRDYPNSTYRDTVYHLLSDAFITSKNYSAALSALDSIHPVTPELNRTKQYLRYQLGSDAFLQNRFGAAIPWLDKVIENEQGNTAYKAEAIYLRGEAEYRINKLDAARDDMLQFLQLDEATQSKNKQSAQYTLAYTFFSKQEYDQAKTLFEQYVKSVPQTDPTYADALNRLADCYFVKRDFINAEKYYAQTVALGQKGSDYAMYQRGYILGLMHRYEDKVKVMENLVRQFPRSDFADDALYESARAELQRHHSEAALNAYERLLKNYPNAPMARKAALEKGMVYYNEQKNAEAIAAYKFVINKYSGSEEAYTALDALEKIYVETNQVQEYLTYIKSIGKMRMQIDAQEDSLVYTAAERQYLFGNYTEAAAGLSRYVEQFCDAGRNCQLARYYLADSYYRIGQKDEALKAYSAIAEHEGSPYLEEAVMRMAEITYDNKQFNLSQQHFVQLEKLSSTLENTNIARLGQLRCAFQLKDTTNIVSSATALITDPSLNAERHAEAFYDRAFAYIWQNDTVKAIDDMRQIANDTRTAMGAEANYRIAEWQYGQGLLDDAENSIMRFAAMNTQHQYWLARSFIVLADIYLDRGDWFQAKQYLLSLKTNYRNQDDVQPMIDSRLESIDKQHQQTEQQPIEENENEED